MDDNKSTSRSRDEPYLNHDLGAAVYGEMLAYSSLCPSIASLSCKNKTKRSNSIDCTPSNSVPASPNLSWLPNLKKRSSQHTQRMEIHQTTCLNLNIASQGSCDSDLWILPDFDDWAAEVEQTSRRHAKSNDWTLYLRRATNSNLERLRNRLEGDGWAFVGGNYDEDKTDVIEDETATEGGIDDEFDLVVLYLGRGRC